MEKENQKKEIAKESISQMTSFLPEKENRLPFFVGAGLIIIAGVVTGYFLSRKGVAFLPGQTTGTPKKVVGSKDTSVFKDKAEGVIEKGGIDGEGTHQLIREGGPSQTAYLTSSVVDLDEFVGQKVRVWGETFAAQKAAWLMDVGRVEVLE